MINTDLLPLSGGFSVLINRAVGAGLVGAGLVGAGLVNGWPRR
jgi:hypothetical protein